MILNSPIIDIVDQIIIHALELNASDVHFEPENNEIKVRFRIDGILYNKSFILNQYSNEVISRIKVLANMNVAEKRLPQDGKFIFKYKSNNLDLRVSTFPTVNGEKVVIRLLNNFQEISIDSLGLDEEILEKIKEITKLPNGFFLAAGPTGSGKTTTLHSMINLLNKKEKNISTLEDPVEYYIPEITQSNINQDIGFGFKQGIRSILRQDPDVIMVGEIRDRDTAQTAIEAALTGHLVLSTVHTNNSIDVIVRLLDMGIESFLINASLSAVLAQRLVRKLCNFCKEKRKLSKFEEDLILKLGLKVNQVYSKSLNPCKDCFSTGYKGRVGIFELLIVDTQIKELIKENKSSKDIYKAALKNNFKTLTDSAINKINSGITDITEVFRILI